MRRILVLEDEFSLAFQTLLDVGDDVEIVGPVGTLDEARKLANDEMLDGALLDVNINGGRVDDVVEILRRRDVPFLFVTANDPDHLPSGLQPGPTRRQTVQRRCPFTRSRPPQIKNGSKIVSVPKGAAPPGHSFRAWFCMTQNFGLSQP